jgi:Protein of unknown function (DUF3990)
MYWTNSSITLYHGTRRDFATDIVDNGVRFDAFPGKRIHLDFGPGFYTTENIEQAAAWADMRHRQQAAIVTLVMDREKLTKLDCLAFGNATTSFWNLVRHHRLGGGTDHLRPTQPPLYDMVVGPVAWRWDRDLRRCAVEEGYDQISFHTEAAGRVLRASTRTWELV